MPDLGRYAAEVLLAYGVTAGAVGALVAVTLWQVRAARREAERAGRG